MNTSRKSDGTELPDGWRMVRMGDVADVRSGIGFPIDRQGRETGTYPFIKVSDMNLAGNEKYIRFANNYVEQLDAAELGGTPLPEGTVIFPKVGAAIATNKKRILTTPTLIDNNMVGISLVSQEICDSRYLFYWFETVDLSSFANVSAVPSITGSRLKQATISLPPLHEQFSIADVLDSIDVAIERTEAVIAATETLRDALLHELLTRGVPGWHTEWKDVPGIGTIPADWEVVPLGEVAEVAFSSVDKKTVPGEVPIRLCNYTDVFYNRRITPDMEFMEATANMKELERWNLRAGDVLFTKDSETSEEIGIPAFVQANIPDVLCGYHLGLARPHAHLLDGAYLAEAFSSPRLAVQFRKIANGVTRFGLTLGATEQLKIPLPPLREQQTMAKLLDGVDATLIEAKKEKDGLRWLKDSTAEALLTGRCHVGR